MIHTPKVAAQNGLKVTLVDLSQPMIDKAKKSIEKNLERVGKKAFKDDEVKIKNFVTESAARISTTTNVEEAAKDTDLVIEAIIEKLSEKQKLFSSIDSVSSQIISSFNFQINIPPI
jgi:3-hydroxyacyl-CoA dehydrogenase